MDQVIRLRYDGSRPKLPLPENLELRFSAKAIEELERIKTHYPDLRSCILPALWIAQREYGGYLPGEALAEVAHRLRRSFAEIEGVASFYTMYAIGHKPGRHRIEVCTCLTCQVCGAYRILDRLKEMLGIEPGETTADGEFTLEEVECLDACDRAPVLMVGDQYIGPVDAKAVEGLVERLRHEKDSTAVKLADAIVRAHLAERERP